MAQHYKFTFIECDKLKSLLKDRIKQMEKDKLLTYPYDLMISKLRSQQQRIIKRQAIADKQLDETY